MEAQKQNDRKPIESSRDCFGVLRLFTQYPLLMGATVSTRASKSGGKYNLKKGWYLSSAPVITANWQASSGNVWNVPVGGGVGRVFRLGFQPVSVAAQFYGNAVHPRNGSSWSMRLQIAFLFPKLPPAMKERLKALQQK